MNLDEYIKEFEYFIHIEKNYSKKTIGTYMKGLELFSDFLKNLYETKNIRLDMIKTEDIRKFIVHYKIERNNKPATLNLKISIIKSFYNFLVERNYILITQNVALTLKQQKLPKTLPMYLTYDEAEKFLLSIKLLSKNATRDYAIFCLFLTTGARLSEITELTFQQINFQDKTVTLFGKGSKERTVCLLDRSAEALKEYINSEKIYVECTSKRGKTIKKEDRSRRGRIASINTSKIFLNKYGKPIGEKGVEDLFKELAEKAGIYRKGLSIHKLRHTCLTLLYRSGVDILTLKAIAGHNNIKTTEIYTHINSENVMRSMQLNPLGNKSYDTELIDKIKRTYSKR